MKISNLIYNKLLIIMITANVDVYMHLIAINELLLFKSKILQHHPYGHTTANETMVSTSQYYQQNQWFHQLQEALKSTPLAFFCLEVYSNLTSISIYLTFAEFLIKLTFHQIQHRFDKKLSEFQSGDPYSNIQKCLH